MKFPSCRPDFLVNPETGRCLELDCYNKTLGIACEYNGIQHYEYPNIYHTDVQQFKDQMRRDKFKEGVCKKNGILLIVVPYTVRDLRMYIEKSVCRYTKLLIKKKIIRKINVTNCTILKDYLTSRIATKSLVSPRGYTNSSDSKTPDTVSKTSGSGKSKTKTRRKSVSNKDDKSRNSRSKSKTSRGDKSKTKSRSSRSSKSKSASKSKNSTKSRRKSVSKTKTKSSGRKSGSMSRRKSGSMTGRKSDSKK